MMHDPLLACTLDSAPESLPPCIKATTNPGNSWCRFFELVTRRGCDCLHARPLHSRDLSFELCEVWDLPGDLGPSFVRYESQEDLRSAGA